MRDELSEPKSVDDRVHAIEQRLNVLLGAFKQLSAINTEQAKRIEDLERKATPMARKARTVNAPIANIAFGAWMFANGYTVRQVADSGVLSYSKAFGITTWDKQYLEEYLKLYDGLEYYRLGDKHPEFNPVVPNPNQE